MACMVVDGNAPRRAEPGTSEGKPPQSAPAGAGAKGLARHPCASSRKTAVYRGPSPRGRPPSEGHPRRSPVSPSSHAFCYRDPPGAAPRSSLCRRPAGRRVRGRRYRSRPGAKPTPAISQLDPGNLLQWSDSTTVTVMGNGFINGAVVRLNGSARPTTYVAPRSSRPSSPSRRCCRRERCRLPSSTPRPAAASPAAAPLPVNHRVPDWLSLEPAGVMQGSAPFTLPIYGGASRRAPWCDGTAPPAHHLREPGEVHAQIPATDLQAGDGADHRLQPRAGRRHLLPRAVHGGGAPQPRAGDHGAGPRHANRRSGRRVEGDRHGFMQASQVSVGGFTPTPRWSRPRSCALR